MPGCEITTADGHLLAYFIQKPVPPGLLLDETLARVKELGGLAVAAHPTAPNSLSAELICRIARHPELNAVMVGIETLNAGLINGRSNRRAQGLAHVLPMAEVGGSDAHLLWMIGGGVTAYPGKGAESLKQALRNRQTRAWIGTRSPLRLIGTWLPHIPLRQAGWVTGNETPLSPVRLARLV